MKRKRADDHQPRIEGHNNHDNHNKRQKLIEARRSLPIWSRQTDIQAAVREHDVLVLSGETGSGKSTQVPQFILHLCKGRVAVTQPRRVAAITLARRVAEEMGTPCGSSSPASKVGYSVRFDQSTSPSTQIKFLTEGMLLQEMLRDDQLGEYGCVVVDEVHERSVNVDLILGFLKQLIPQRRKRNKPLKVVVMSATVDVDRVAHFFSTPSSTLPEAEKQLSGANTSCESASGEDYVWEGFPNDVNETTKVAIESVKKLRVAQCDVEGRQYPVKLHYLDKPTDDVIDAALQRIFNIHCREAMPGDVLVFMTGQETIQGLQKLIEE
jgi:ATP-dependent RNA helicase DHR2